MRHHVEGEDTVDQARSEDSRRPEPGGDNGCLKELVGRLHQETPLWQDFLLAHAYAGARSLRLADGPDEVHRAQIGKLELSRYRSD